MVLNTHEYKYTSFKVQLQKDFCIINTADVIALSLQKEWGAATCVVLGSEEPSVSEAYKQRDSEDKKKQRGKIKEKIRK